MGHFVLVLTMLILPIMNAKPLGVVVWHGMGDTATGRGINRLCEMIKEEIPDTYILNIEFGSSSIEDRLNTFIMPIKKQLSIACNMIRIDNNLAHGFHLIGFSQGGLFVRALAQICPRGELGSVVSIGGPQQGVFGLPSCTTKSLFCDLIRNMLNKLVYSDFIQSHLVQAQYWQDPYRRAVYKAKSQFLADINQENRVNETYRENLVKARNLVLVRFLHDTMVVPHISEWFGFYNANQTQSVYNTTESEPYKSDSLGLKTLDKQNKLHLIPLPGDHLRFSDIWFKSVIIDKFLKDN